ncbi:hypothetical protein D3C77_657970 [compost metagenome]
MRIHPLFAGFAGCDASRVGAALGFAVHVETRLGPLPEQLSAEQRSRLSESGDLPGYLFAGGWNSPGVHGLLFVKPLSAMAAAWWRVGVEHSPE